MLPREAQNYDEHFNMPMLSPCLYFVVLAIVIERLARFLHKQAFFAAFIVSFEL